MEGELGSGARIAIALIVIGVIISVIFVILGFTRGTTNQGISGVSTSMDAMTLARFDDYDQKTISGTQVIAAVKLFEGQPVATVVRTTATMSAAGGANTGNNYGALLTNSNKVEGNDYYTTAVITRTEAQENDSFYTVSLVTPISHNLKYTPMTDAGTNQFVRPTAKFLAELMKDSTGMIVGICFTQLA
ncbi:hypothetical protein [Cohnella panacarvi]|uniref:hypothetical protein n=1 Tax=Cohnella panacarvi TaxID=400776 RepID=UPI00047BACE5|nr:hypothetical protein [Cohnella panacarvi]